MIRSPKNYSQTKNTEDMMTINFKSVKLAVALVAMVPMTSAYADDGQGGKLELTSSEQQLADKNNAFAFRLFSEVSEETSMVISPLSITYALSMLNNGAAGETRQEISDVLGFGEADLQAVNDLCHKVMTASSALDPLTQVSVANAVFLNKGYQLKPAFAETAQTYYDATLESRDFADGQTLDAINLWASNHTNGAIPAIFDASEFDPTAASYLLNATYFKGAWTQKFDPSNTQSEPFGDSGEQVDMMHMRTRMYYTSNGVFQALQMPYGNRSFNMTLLLPREDKTLGDVVASVSSKPWSKTLLSFGNNNVDIKLPRMDIGSRLLLEKALNALGIRKAFERTADFSEFCEQSTHIDIVKQAAHLKMDEDGTEASAVTGIDSEPPSLEGEGSSVYNFHANRPFLFVVSEANSGLILFMGQYLGTGQTNANATGIQSHRSLPVSEPTIHDLQGRRLSTLQKGINIVDGRKVVVR